MHGKMEVGSGGRIFQYPPLILLGMPDHIPRYGFLIYCLLQKFHYMAWLSKTDEQNGASFGLLFSSFALAHSLGNLNGFHGGVLRASRGVDRVCGVKGDGWRAGNLFEVSLEAKDYKEVGEDDDERGDDHAEDGLQQREGLQRRATDLNLALPPTWYTFS